MRGLHAIGMRFAASRREPASACLNHQTVSGRWTPQTRLTTWRACPGAGDAHPGHARPSSRPRGTAPSRRSCSPRAQTSGPGALPLPTTTTRRRWAARLRSLSLQPPLPLLPVRQCPAQKRVKRRPMMSVDQVTKLMRHHVINARPRRLDQFRIQVDYPAAGPAPPPLRHAPQQHPWRTR
jgi:hypothetical protein